MSGFGLKPTNMRNVQGKPKHQKNSSPLSIYGHHPGHCTLPNQALHHNFPSEDLTVPTTPSSVSATPKKTNRESDRYKIDCQSYLPPPVFSEDQDQEVVEVEERTDRRPSVEIMAEALEFPQKPPITRSQAPRMKRLNMGGMSSSRFKRESFYGKQMLNAADKLRPAIDDFSSSFEGPEAGNTISTKQRTLYQKDQTRDYVSIHDDVYNLFFLSNVGGHAFFYSFYVFTLKMALYTFLAIDVIRTTSLSQEMDVLVLMSQFLIVPVMVAFQDDLTATYYLIANIKYCETVRNENPEASKWKFYVATACRAVDGLFSLIVNFVVLVSATSVLSMFLNFAALQFLQTIDNIALELAADGYLTERLETVAVAVKVAELPKRSEENWLRSMDTILFLGTVAVLYVFWAYFAFLSEII